MTFSVLSVDLAAKLSAVIQRGAGGEVLAQLDSRGKPPLVFLREVAYLAVESDLTVVEDVPYGITSQAMVKPVLRLQGALVAYLTATWSIEKTIFMSPSTWMKEFPGTQHAPRGMAKAAADAYRIDQAAQHARDCGYEPPDLVAEYIAANPGKKILKKDTNVLTKSMTDYVSAFLMSEFTRMHTVEKLLTLPGVSKASLSNL